MICLARNITMEYIWHGFQAPGSTVRKLHWYHCYRLALMSFDLRYSKRLKAQRNKQMYLSAGYICGQPTYESVFCVK